MAPDAAAAMPAFADGGTTLTVPLRTDLTWPDGTPLPAAAWDESWHLGWGPDGSAGARAEAEIVPGSVSVTAGGRSLVMHLVAADFDFARQLAMPWSAAWRQGQAGPEGAGAYHVVSTGAGGLELAARDAHARPQHIVVSSGWTAATAASALLEGKLDALVGPSAQCPAAGRAWARPAALTSLVYLALNHQKPPFASRTWRLVAALAVDPGRLPLPAGDVPAAGLLPGGLDYARGEKWWVPDPASARRMLAGAAGPHAQAVMVDPGAFAADAPLQAAIGQELAAVGLVVAWGPAPPPPYSLDQPPPGKLALSDATGAVASLAVLDEPSGSALAFENRLLGSDHAAPGDTNASYVLNRTINYVLGLAPGLSRTAERAAAVREVAHQAALEAALAPLYWTATGCASATWPPAPAGKALEVPWLALRP